MYYVIFDKKTGRYVEDTNWKGGQSVPKLCPFDHQAWEIHQVTVSCVGVRQLRTFARRAIHGSQEL